MTGGERTPTIYIVLEKMSGRKEKQTRTTERARLQRTRPKQGRGVRSSETAAPLAPVGLDVHTHHPRSGRGRFSGPVARDGGRGGGGTPGSEGGVCAPSSRASSLDRDPRCGRSASGSGRGAGTRAQRFSKRLPHLALLLPAFRWSPCAAQTVDPHPPRPRPSHCVCRDTEMAPLG